MQKMIRSPAQPGTIGALWCLHLVAAIYARRLNRATAAVTVAHAGQKRFMKSSIKYTRKFRMSLSRKLTSLQATGRRKRDHKLRVQAFASLQAPGLGNQGTSVQAGPGHKLPGQKYFFYA